MDAQSMPKVQMPNRDGFLIDDRPDTQAARCMTNCSEREARAPGRRARPFCFAA